MSVIISLHEQISYMKSVLDEFNKKHKKYAVDLSRPQIRELLILLIDDTLSEGLRWAKRTHHFDKRLRELVPWYDECNDITVVESFDDLVVNQFDEQLLVFEDHIRSKPWDFKITKRHGDDLAISNVGDYRILDWERRIASGEWQMNK